MNDLTVPGGTEDYKKGGPVSRVLYPFRGRRHPSRSTVSRRIRATNPWIISALRPRRGSSPPLLGLARSEACRAVVVADDAVGSYPAISPSPTARKRRRQFTFCCAVCPP